MAARIPEIVFFILRLVAFIRATCLEIVEQLFSDLMMMIVEPVVQSCEFRSSW